jgi:hypothetical protein
MDPIDEEAIVKDYKEGLGLYEIHKKYRVSMFQVGFILGKHGITRRNIKG